ncbi:hypothetical protein EYF80_031275 [Liparis tanakae]|uniref:Uncharacterized protein n=1 Tax=Liparis tanakae TaxID=230148 RepID=A0A4Z2H0Q6_9TELE|nr:hypothetical protein EYF80_031275 [Liparis tanakae]
MGSSAVTTGASGTQEELACCGATEAGGPGAKPTGESFPSRAARPRSRRQSPGEHPAIEAAFKSFTVTATLPNGSK